MMRIVFLLILFAVMAMGSCTNDENSSGLEVINPVDSTDVGTTAASRL